MVGCLVWFWVSGLFYKTSNNGWEKLVLILVTVILALVKNYLVGGKGNGGRVKGSLLEEDTHEQAGQNKHKGLP